MDLGILDNVSNGRRGVEAPGELISTRSRPSLNGNGNRPCCVPQTGGRGLQLPAPASTAQADAAEVGTRDENLQVLRAITTSKKFTDFQRAFAEATGLPVDLRPVESFQLSLRDVRNQGPFCALMARENRTCGACLQSQFEVAQAGTERPQTTSCYAGLCEAVVPLRVGKRLIGFLSTGQVFLRKPTARQFERTVTLLRTWGLNRDKEELRGAYFGTRQVSRDQLEAAVKLLTIFAEHLVTLSTQILIQRDNAEPPMITKAKQFIREHYTEDLSLRQVAGFANASPFYFCKMFKRVTGLSFTNFISHVRIETSKTLLMNPQVRVSEVAYEVGFQSLTHFNRMFQKILGESPTEYRQKVASKRSLNPSSSVTTREVGKVREAPKSRGQLLLPPTKLSINDRQL